MKYINKDLGKRNIKDSTSIVDILVEVGNIIINLEAYTSYGELEKNKNINYISKVWIKNYNYKNQYKNKKEIVQINLIQSGKEDKYYIKGKEKYIKNVKIIDILIDKEKDKRYTKGKQESNLEKWNKFLISEVDKEKLKKIIDSMNYKKEIKEGMKGEIERYMTQEDAREIGTTLGEWIEIKQFNARERGLEEGRKEGEKNTIFKHIMKMLKKNIKYSDISDITGESIEKIESYSHELDLNSLND